MDKKNIVILILAVLLTAVVVGGGVYLWQRDDESTDTADEITTTQTETESTDVVATEIEETTTEPEETGPSPEDGNIIAGLLSDKHGKSAEVTVNENTGDHAQGLVKFPGEVAGGWWLAAKESGEWVLVADGNGVVMCSDIDPYNFPTDMVPECWDDTTETLITR